MPQSRGTNNLSEIEGLLLQKIKNRSSVGNLIAVWVYLGALDTKLMSEERNPVFVGDNVTYTYL